MFSERNIEKYSPAILAILSGIILFLSAYDISTTPNFKDLLRSTVTISAILIGFLATMMSILIAASTKKVIKIICVLHATSLLRSYFLQTLFSGFLVAISSTLLNMAEGQQGIWSRLVLCGWGTLVVFFLGCAARIMWIMSGVLHSVIEENQIDSGSENRVEADPLEIVKGGKK